MSKTDPCNHPHHQRPALCQRPIHIGHLVEYIQTDIWARFQKLRGHNCWYVCADDAHGTPIMLRARAEGIAPEALIARVWPRSTRRISPASASASTTTTRPTPPRTGLRDNLIYERNRDAGHIVRRTIQQAYDPVEQMFLPDRFIKGECPKCGAADQYGDNCEVCGASYSPAELKNPRSAVSGACRSSASPSTYFFKLATSRSC
jgi:methionyl-tRNA synthetase